ncbi:MAG: cation:proton antiporter [Alphaproteobacteria bacterium]|nr:cation:proton antiporter [Alphaproteobacteria bacterium]
MPVHDFGLLSTLVVSLVAAFAGGLLVRSIKLPPLLGYLLAGVVIGPFTPGLIANQAMANELAEVGVALLLFNIGLHFSFKDLLAVQKIVVPGALIQVAFTSTVGAILSSLILGTPLPASIVVGLTMAIASTAVATRVLAERRQLTSLAGRVALGWLVVQDLVVIFALVLFPLVAAAEDADIAHSLQVFGKTLLQVTGFVAVMVFGGRRVIPWLLNYVARVGSRELFTLAVIVIALGIAYGSSLLFGVSLALGAFFAGVVIGESDLNHHAASEALAMQQVFTILFFVSVGMLFDPQSVMRMPGEILVFLLTIILGTGVFTFILLLFFRVPLMSAALVGAAFMQIGEFSFVLSELGFKNGFYGAPERDLIIAVALLSIFVNPVLLMFVMRFVQWFSNTSAYVKWRNTHHEITLSETEGLHDHTIIVGHGRVGSIVAKAMGEQGLRYVVIESDRTLTERLRLQGLQVIYGDASREAVMAAAHPEWAKLMIIALPDPYFVKQIVRSVRKNFPDIKIVVRTHAEDETKALTKMGVGFAVMGEREIALGLTYHALQALGFDLDHTRSTIVELRKQIYAIDQDVVHA